MLIADHPAGKVFLGIFIAVCAISDFRKKSIDMRIFIITAMLEALAYIWMLLADVSINWSCMAIGAAVGMLMLIISGITKGQIGAGDAVFLILTGIAMGGYRNVLLCCSGMLASALFGILMCMIRIFRGKSIRGYDFAFIPLLAPIGMVILICA